MDNGAYEKYRTENPIVNTLLINLDKAVTEPEKLNHGEIAIVVIFLCLSAYAIVKLFLKYFRKRDAIALPDKSSNAP